MTVCYDVYTAIRLYAVLLLLPMQHVLDKTKMPSSTGHTPTQMAFLLTILLWYVPEQDKCQVNNGSSHKRVDTSAHRCQ